MKRPWPRFPLVLPYVPFKTRVMWMAVVLALAAGVLNLFFDVDAFEERTGFFDTLGTWIINAAVGLIGLSAALYGATLFAPRSWGEKAGVGGALVAALIAAFCFSALWHGGAG